VNDIDEVFRHLAASSFRRKFVLRDRSSRICKRGDCRM